MRKILLHLRLRRYRGFSLVFFAVVPGIYAQQDGSCNSVGIGEQLISGNPALALRYSQQCVSYYKTATANLPKGGPLGGWEPLDVFNLGYHLCGTAQIEAMMGDLKAAETSIVEAEQIASNWSGWFNSPLVKWSDVIESTRGFYLEKAGNLDAVKGQYANHPSSYSLSRLAILALSDGNHEEAIRWAQKALAIDAADPTAHVVLASIFEKTGNVLSALHSYEAALRFMEEAPQRHQFLPITFAESATARAAISRLRAGGAPSQK